MLCIEKLTTCWLYDTHMAQPTDRSSDSLPGQVFQMLRLRPERSHRNLQLEKDGTQHSGKLSLAGKIFFINKQNQSDFHYYICHYVSQSKSTE